MMYVGSLLMIAELVNNAAMLSGTIFFTTASTNIWWGIIAAYSVAQVIVYGAHIGQKAKLGTAVKQSGMKIRYRAYMLYAVTMLAFTVVVYAVSQSWRGKAKNISDFEDGNCGGGFGAGDTATCITFVALSAFAACGNVLVLSFAVQCLLSEVI